MVEPHTVRDDLARESDPLYVDDITDLLRLAALNKLMVPHQLQSVHFTPHHSSAVSAKLLVAAIISSTSQYSFGLCAFAK